MFWQDFAVARETKQQRARADLTMPSIPDTGWRPPTSFPRLEAAKALSIDVETRDKGLEQGLGPGWCFPDGGYLVGISVCTHDGYRWYFPMRHEVGGGNLNPAAVLAWAKDEFGRENQPKIGAQLLYDLGWLLAEGVTVRGELHDAQYAEPLLDEHARSYSLGALSERYALTVKGKGEAEESLYQWLSMAYGGEPTRRAQAGNIYRSPVALAGPYAEQDAVLPFHLVRKQIKHLKEQGLYDLYRMECDLIPVYLAMRLAGIRVDHEEAQRTADRFEREEREWYTKLGPGANVNSVDWLQRAFDKEGIVYPRTAPSKAHPQGRASFTDLFLQNAPGDLPAAIRAIRRLQKARGTFLDGYILNKHRDGYVHGEFHPLRSDHSGTISGRLSSSNPNLQNIPARDPEMKQCVRGLFVPDTKDSYIFAPDYSQIEYRLMVGKAVGPGAEEARQNYRNNPDTDYHRYVQQRVKDLLGIELPRKPIKNINFGIIFGMGEAKLRAMLGLDEAAASQFFDAYHAGVPFARPTREAATKAADRRGYITTVLGRRARFPHWETKDWKQSRKDGWFLYDQAAEKYGPYAIRRARTHKALNAYTQGSGGDILKKAMLLCWRELGLAPRINVHDELVFVLPRGAVGASNEADIVRIMAGAVDIGVPLLVSSQRGESWGAVSEKGTLPGMC